MIKDPVEANALIDDISLENQKVLGEQVLETTKTVGKGDIENIQTNVLGHVYDPLGGKCDTELRRAKHASDLLIVPAREEQIDDVSPLLSCDMGRPTVDGIKARMNQYFPVVPDDFFHFDFAELGNDGQSKLFASDSRARPTCVPGFRPVPMSCLTIRQQEISVWWGTHDVGDV